MNAPVVQIGTVNRCNEKCVFCPNPTLKKPKGVMPWDVFTRIIDTETSRIYDLCLFGEPLLDPLLPQRIEYIKQRHPNSEVYFHTNAILLTPKVADRLRDARLDRIVVSVYGLGKQGHKALQPIGKWDSLVENVRYAAQVIPVMVVGNKFDDPVEQIASESFWNSLGCTTHYNTFIEYGDAQTAPQVIAPIQRCTFALGFKTYDYDGAMVMCCLDFENKTAFGNVAVDTWDEAIKRIVAFPEFCKTCALLGELEAHWGLKMEDTDVCA